MRTSKPISTISYNTEEFLKGKVEYWKGLGLIEFGMWIKHKPDEDNKKDHFHVFLKPAKLIQTMDLEMDSCELDPNNPDKPLKMIGFRVSKENDWVLYGLHDKEYLASKGMTRNIHYDLSDIKSTDSDTLADIITHLNDERKGKLETRILECVRMGLAWGDIVSSGLIPLRHMHNAKLLYDALTFHEPRNEKSAGMYERDVSQARFEGYIQGHTDQRLKV